MRLNKPLFIAALVLTVGCRSAPPEDANALVLKTYDVPKGSARALVATLADAFWMGDNKLIGRAAVTPDGRLTVLAPPNVQSGVVTLVDDIAKHPIVDQTIELHYFLVVGKPGAAAEPGPTGVGEIQPALDEIVRSQGPQSFTVVHRARLSTLNGDSGEVQADKLKIKQKAALTSDGVDAMVELDFSGNDKLESRVHLTPERIVVLGATGQRNDANDGSTLYYVVRVAPRGKQP